MRTEVDTDLRGGVLIPTIGAAICHEESSASCAGTVVPENGDIR